MKREKDVPIPGPLRAALRDEPPEERRRLEQIWGKLPDVEHHGSFPDVDEAWSDLSRRLDAASRVEPRSDRRYDRGPSRRRDRGIARRSIGVAALLVVTLVVAALWILNRPLVIEARPGEQQTVRLADGSVVDLNSDTRLQVASTFRSTLFRSDLRRVQLEGEAFFRVADDARTFVVETSDAELRVLGTEFNVHSRGTDVRNGTKVTLVTGAVEVALRNGGAESVTLDEPGSTASVVSPSRVDLTTADKGPTLDHVLAWRRHGFAFIDTPISIILNEVERRFGVSVDPRSGVHLDERMNLFYSRGVTPEEILQDICFEQNCKYRPTNRGFALTRGDGSTP